MAARPERSSLLHYLVVGAGYTGRRVVNRLPPGRSAVASRPGTDLDRPDPLLPAVPAPFAVLYTVPPANSGADDPRLAALLGALRQTPARFVYLSTTGVYGDCGGGRVDEDSPARPGSPRAERRLAAEQMLARWSDRNGVALVVLRVPAIYGPGRLGLDRIERGDPDLAVADAGPGNRIHVDDLAGCCVRALSADAPPGVYNVGDGDHRSKTAFTRLVAELAGLPAPPTIPLAEARRRFDPGRLSFLEERRLVATERMRTVLGFEPVYGDPADGIRASLGG